jgi:hypothetical protein
MESPAGTFDFDMQYAIMRRRDAVPPPDGETPMIFWKESFDLLPASPATRDRFVDVASAALLPAAEAQGARPVGAWFCHEEWFSQVVHVTAFDDLAAFGAYREAAAADGVLAKAEAQAAELAPERRGELLETLGPIPDATLDAAIARSQEKPAGVYTFAILEVAPGCMDRFSAMLGAAGPSLPIVASWREVSGNPQRVIDLWRGDTGRPGYEPSNDGMDAFFGPLREVAPRERMMRLHALPYSPLR